MFRLCGIVPDGFFEKKLFEIIVLGASLSCLFRCSTPIHDLPKSPRDEIPELVNTVNLFQPSV